MNVVVPRSFDVELREFLVSLQGSSHGELRVDPLKVRLTTSLRGDGVTVHVTRMVASDVKKTQGNWWATVTLACQLPDSAETVTYSSRVSWIDSDSELGCVVWRRPEAV